MKITANRTRKPLAEGKPELAMLARPNEYGATDMHLVIRIKGHKADGSPQDYEVQLTMTDIAQLDRFLERNGVV